MMLRRAGDTLNRNLVEIILLGVLVFLWSAHAPAILFLLLAVVFILQLSVRGAEYAVAREGKRKTTP